MSMQRVSLGLLLVAYLVLGSLFALLTPAWQVPDEPAHYNYVRQLSEGRRGCCPTIAPGDWDQPYLATLTGERFAPYLLGNLSSIRYENHQPPLYYLLSSLVYGWTSGSLVAMRLFSVVLGAGVVWCTWAISRALLPQRPYVALAAAALVAFIPQHLTMLSGVNNDSLVELLMALTLLVLTHYLTGQPAASYRLGQALLIAALGGLTLLLVMHRIYIAPALLFVVLLAIGTQARLLRSTHWPLWLLGMLVGLIFLTKATGYLLAGVVLLALILRWWPQRKAQPFPFLEIVLFLLPALALGAMWWLRNISVYGFPDFLGLAAHDRIVTDQPRTADYIALNGMGAYLRHAVTTTFNSFWGQFGWMALPLQGWMYTLLAVFSGMCVSGLALDRFWLVRQSKAERSPAPFRLVWLTLSLTVLLVALMFVYYNLEFLQLQGRYLFYGLVPAAIFLALGLDAWRRWLLPRMPWMTAAIPLLLGPFSLYLLLRVIRPLLLP